jgi:hypothetical protein
MEDLITEFFLRGVAFPLLAALVLAGVIHFALPGTKGPRLAGASIGLAFLLAFGLVAGWPPLPPLSATQKLPYLVLAGLVVGGGLDFVAAGRFVGRAAALLWPALIVGWLGWRQAAGGGPQPTATIVLLWLGGAFVLFLLDEAREGGAKPHAALLVASIGASLIAFLGSAASSAQLFGALAAAIGGALLWNWPRPRHPFGAAANLGAAGAFAALAASLVLFAEVSQAALFVLLLVFLAPRMVALSPSANRPALGTLAAGLVSLVIAGLALAIAYFSTGEPPRADLAPAEFPSPTI